MQWIVEPKMDIVERLNTVREGMEAGLDDWPIASQIYEYKTAAEEITKLRETIPAQAAVIEKLREVLEELVDLVQDIRAGEYKPDSFTCQPALAVLALPTDSTQILDEVRKQERCAARAEAYAYISQNFNALAEEIRAME